jgi:hypothetical protein
MTLTKDPVVLDRSHDLPDLRRTERPATKPFRWVRWVQWGVGVTIVALLALFALFGEDPIPESTLILGPRHDGVVFVPEYVGRSGGDLPAIESSPLSFGPRHIDGVAFVPEYVGTADGVHDEDNR